MGAVGVVVDGAVDVDGDLERFLVEEVRCGAVGAEAGLGAVGEPQVPGLESVEEIPLEVGPRRRPQPLEMLGPAHRGGARRHRGTGETCEDVERGVAVEEPVVPLVAVAHEAVVTGRLAALAGTRCTVLVGAGVGVEVAELQRRPGDAGERGRVVDESAEHAGPAIGGLVEQDAEAVLWGGQGLGGEV